MSYDQRDLLRGIKTFPSLVKYLRDELDWPIESGDFEDLTFDYEPDELGIDSKVAAKIENIKQLRPITANQPWGIFFVKFAPKRLPVVALRRILGQLVFKKRASAKHGEQATWDLNDLMFISNYGEGDRRQITFAHFSQDESKGDLPTLKVLGWDNLDTPLHIDHVAEILTERLTWPDDEADITRWRESWSSAFTLRHREVITKSKVLAVRLAVLARAICDRIQTVLSIETKNGPVTKLMKAFQEVLIHDLDTDGFADMYAQTIAYGLLTARITNPKANTADGFAAHLPVTNPFLKELMETFIYVGGRKGGAGQDPGIDFDELGVSEVVELLDNANMEAVVRDFGDRNPQEDPVIHFYELFLKEYDPKKRMQRGAFYTPQPVVFYIIRSVHELLQTEFDLEDGLASTVTWGEMARKHAGITIPPVTSPDSPFVMVLDIATGTGTFLVEAIDVIHKTMTAKWQKHGKRKQEITKLWNEYVPKHLLPRLYGYELMMAPYAIAHMKIGLKLFETEYHFKSEERVRVYLTNTLEPPSDAQQSLVGIVPTLAHEAQAVNEVKRTVRFTVVVGNPPYSNYGQLNRIPFILNLLKDYKKGLNERKINLDDDFIKFVRLAHHFIEISQLGIMGLITNNVFLDGLTHRKMREALLSLFTFVDILDLHGNVAAHESAVDGTKDENVFDITQGVSISVMYTKPRMAPTVNFHEIKGTRTLKYEYLMKKPISITSLKPHSPHFFLVPKDLALGSEYMAYYPVTAIFNRRSYGIQTKRDALTVSLTRDDALTKAKDTITLCDEVLREKYGLPADGRDWAVKWARADLKRLNDLEAHTRQVFYRPFDIRWTMYTDKSKGFLGYPRWGSMRCMLEDNLALIAMRQVFQNVEFYSHFGATKFLIDERTFYSNRGGTYLFPLYEDVVANSGTLFAARQLKQPNLSTKFLVDLRNRLRLKVSPQSNIPEGITPEDIFFYLYAIFYSLNYRIRYAEFLKIDFPRVPLTSSLELFRSLAKLGGILVALHLLESPKLNDHLTTLIGSGKFLVEKVSYSEETVWIDKAKSSGFQGVPEDTWNFTIGGYQVCEKWLKDRQAKGGKKPRPGRILTDEDIDHYQKIVVALNETIRLMDEIDEVIEKHGGWPDAFKN